MLSFSRAGQKYLPFVMFPVAFLILFLRSPKVLLNAQFWAEDGWAWWPMAYILGPKAFLLPQMGYLQTISRIGGQIAVFFPLSWGPTIFAVMALAAQAGIASFLFSERLNWVWPDIKSRCIVAAFYLAMPNSFEVYGKLTDTQWHLILGVFLVILSRRPSSRPVLAAELLFIFIASISGPLAIFMAPSMVVFLYFRKYRQGLLDHADILRMIPLCCGAIIQLCLVLTAGMTQHVSHLGASVPGFFRIMAKQVFFGFCGGMAHMQKFYINGVWWPNDTLNALITVTGLGLCGLAFYKGEAIFRSFFLFAALSFCATLMMSFVAVGAAQWDMMVYSGNRYYFIPMLAWMGALLTLALQKKSWEKYIGAAGLLMAAIVAVPTDWHIAAPDSRIFYEAAREFDNAPIDPKKDYFIPVWSSDGFSKFRLIKFK